MSHHDKRIAIIGAGFSGLGVAIRLQQAGYRNLTIYERASDVGGTWRDNTYPGAACDVQSHLYSYSFAPSPDWSRAYGTQDEILAYIRHCVDRFELRRLIKFDTNVERAEFDDQREVWQITTHSGRTRDCRTGGAHARVSTHPVMDHAETGSRL
jgi:cation diffusion facilitator CzcD-associated flavoprotein CzcO